MWVWKLYRQCISLQDDRAALQAFVLKGIEGLIGLRMIILEVFVRRVGFQKVIKENKDLVDCYKKFCWLEVNRKFEEWAAVRNGDRGYIQYAFGSSGSKREELYRIVRVSNRIMKNCQVAWTCVSQGEDIHGESGSRDEKSQRKGQKIMRTSCVLKEQEVLFRWRFSTELISRAGCPFRHRRWTPTRGDVVWGLLSLKFLSHFQWCLISHNYKCVPLACGFFLLFKK